MLILPCSLQPRQNLLQAAGLVGQTSGELLQQIGESDTDPRFQVSVPTGNHGCTLPKTISLCTGPDRRLRAKAWPVPGGDFAEGGERPLPISLPRAAVI